MSGPLASGETPVTNFTNFEGVRSGYANLWAAMRIRPERLATARAIAAGIARDRARYEAVAGKTGVPWHWIAIVHHLESRRNFATHLHNGDSLRRRTVQVPAGRPKTGSPPFAWEESAIDALRLKGLHRETDWSIPKQLWQFERYNGFGYVQKKINSPYVWSFSSLYSHGKYVADGRYSASAISQQCGAAVILKCLLDAGHLNQEIPSMSELKPFLDIISVVAPTVATAIGGQAAGLAVRALAEALDTDATAGAVATKLDGSPFSQIVAALRHAEAEFSGIDAAPVVRAEPMPSLTLQPEASAPVSPNGVLVDPTASVAKTLVAGILFVLCSLFVKDVATAQTLANALAPLAEALITGLGGGILTWLLHRSVSNANANTVAVLTK